MAGIRASVELGTDFESIASATSVIGVSTGLIKYRVAITVGNPLTRRKTVASKENDFPLNDIHQFNHQLAALIRATFIRGSVKYCARF